MSKHCGCCRTVFLPLFRINSQRYFSNVTTPVSCTLLAKTGPTIEFSILRHIACQQNNFSQLFVRHIYALSRSHTYNNILSSSQTKHILLCATNSSTEAVSSENTQGNSDGEKKSRWSNWTGKNSWKAGLLFLGLTLGGFAAPAISLWGRYIFPLYICCISLVPFWLLK